jgi:hypothetical protein
VVLLALLVLENKNPGGVSYQGFYCLLVPNKIGFDISYQSFNSKIVPPKK